MTELFITGKIPNGLTLSNGWTVSCSQILDYKSVACNDADLFIGDKLVYNYQALSLAPVQIPQISDFASSQFQLPAQHWLFAFYPQIRMFAEGPRNNYQVIGFKIIESSFTRKSPEMLEKLRENISEAFTAVVDYLIICVQHKDFATILLEFCTKEFYIESLGKEVYRRCNHSIEEIARFLDVSMHFVSIVSCNLQCLNPLGSVRFNFLLSNDCFHVLYTRHEVSIHSGNHGLATRVKRRSSMHFDEHTSLHQSVRQASGDFCALQTLMHKKIKDSLLKAVVNPQINQGIALLSRQKVDITELNRTRQNLSCLIGNEFGNNIKLDCGHYYCPRCLDGHIEKSTRIIPNSGGVYVMNAYEKTKYPSPKCVNPFCAQPISDEIIAKNINNYESYAKNADARNSFRCNKCELSFKFEEFSLTCLHCCDKCFNDELMKSTTPSCPHCSRSVTKDEIYKMFNKKRICNGCNRELSIRKCFWVKFCEHELCNACVSLSAKNGHCFFCAQNFTFQGYDFTKMNISICSRCHCEYDTFLSFDCLRTCFCGLCDKCQLDISTESCGNCGIEFQAELKEKMNSECSYCLICNRTVKNLESFSMQCCRNIVCKECFKNNTNALLSENKIESLQICPICNQMIKGAQLTEVFDSNTHERIISYKIDQNSSFITCPSCNHYFSMNAMSTKVACPSCRAELCADCEQAYHSDNRDCRKQKIDEQIKLLEAINEPSGISQCPRCRLPYNKDKKCEHVRCMNNKCMVEFCFKCSCLRGPTLAHGSHYHRPSCPFYSKHKNELIDKIEEKCPECMKTGSLCKRPNNLRVERRVDADEAS
jgi:hypothetical protein